MTPFKTPFLAFALMMATVSHFGSASLTPEAKCTKIIKDYYGNNGNLKGVENFQHSFFKKTLESIKNDFKEEAGEDWKEKKARLLRLNVVMMYYKVLFDGSKIKPMTVLGHSEWCKGQAAKVLKQIKDENIDVDDVDKNDISQNVICQNFAKLMQTTNEEEYPVIESEDIHVPLEWFYFTTLEDSMTVEKIYEEKFKDAEPREKLEDMFYIKEYTIAYYEQYRILVKKLVEEENGEFEDVGQFCSSKGKEAVEEKRNPIEACRSIIINHYSNNRYHSGVENFQYSFFEKTRELINEQFEEVEGDDEEDQIEKQLVLRVVMKYFEVLYDENQIETNGVLGHRHWCSGQASKVLQYIIDEKINYVKEDELTELGQKQICIEFVEILGNFIGTTKRIYDITYDFDDAFQWFYFKVTKDSMTAENIYNEEVSKQLKRDKDEIMFYIEKYIEPFYEQYKILVSDLVKSKNGRFESVDDFCKDEGKKVVEDHRIELECRNIIVNNYGNKGKLSGVDNFKYSFFKQTRNLIKQHFIKQKVETDVERKTRELRLKLNMKYFEVLYEKTEIKSNGVYGHIDWCNLEGPKVLKYLEKNTLECIKDIELNKNNIIDICLEYVKYLYTSDEDHLEDFGDALKLFYFNVTKKSVTAEKIYNEKFSTKPVDKKEQYVFFLAKFAVPFYQQYTNLINNLITENNGRFESVDEFCQVDGKIIMKLHPVPN